MPFRVERKESIVSKQALKRLAQSVNLNPTGVILTQAADIYATVAPRELRDQGIFTGRWSKVENIPRKRSQYGAVVVPAKDYEKWGQRPDQADKVNNWIKHATDKEVVLMYYPNPDLLIRRNALGPHAAIQQYLSQQDIAAFESQSDARRLDKTNRPATRAYPQAFESPKEERLTEAEWEARQLAKPGIGIAGDGSLKLIDPENQLGVSGTESSDTSITTTRSGDLDGKKDPFSV